MQVLRKISRYQIQLRKEAGAQENKIHKSRQVPEHKRLDRKVYRDQEKGQLPMPDMHQKHVQYIQTVQL